MFIFGTILVVLFSLLVDAAMVNAKLWKDAFLQLIIIVVVVNQAIRLQRWRKRANLNSDDAALIKITTVILLVALAYASYMFIVPEMRQAHSPAHYGR